MPRERGKYNKILESKSLTTEFKKQYKLLRVNDLTRMFGISRNDYQRLQRELQLETKTNRDRPRFGLAKFYDWEPLDPTIFDFGIIVKWTNKMLIPRTNA